MAANKKWAILYCPKKGMYSRGVRWSKVEKCLMDNGIDFDYVQSENANSVERLITMFIENGCWWRLGPERCCQLLNAY